MRLVRIGALALAGMAAAALPARAGSDGAAVIASAVGTTAPAVSREVGLPRVLSRVDVRLYRRLFDLQRDGRWQQADALMDGLDDRLLLGHILAQRYLHRDYLSSYDELRAWLKRHGDHPQAQRIHRLAQRKRPKGAPPPPAPQGGYLVGTGIDSGDAGASWEREVYDHLWGGKGEVAVIKRKLRQRLRLGYTLAAKRLLRDDAVRRALPRVSLDAAHLALANRYLADGRIDFAYDWAAQAARHSGDALPAAHWTAGLAAWRLHRYEDARAHFEAVAQAKDASRWMVSAGAYWAARANLVTRRPEAVNRWLEVAAQWPRTFYGLLARRALGLGPSLTFEQRPLTDLDVRVLLGAPAGQRALALLQLDRRADAEAELRKLYPRAEPAMVEAMLALAEAAEMPELTLKLGSLAARQDGRYHDMAAYPLPAWRPQDGWRVDRALLLAIARQESGFDPTARSPAGARGLMQLMPATAKFVAGGTPGDLSDPQYNLSLGQRYVEHLLEHPAVDGNLLLMLAAYNGGLGNLVRWKKELDYGEDPLLFMESIPSPETRIFVERVLTNFWIYRARMQQPAPTLAAVSSGRWPTYRALDVQLAENRL